MDDLQLSFCSGLTTRLFKLRIWKCSWGNCTLVSKLCHIIVEVRIILSFMSDLILWKSVSGFILIFFLCCLDLANSTGIFAKSAAMLANCEEHTSLSRALSQLAQTEEKIDLLYQEQAVTDYSLLAELQRDYIGLLGTVKVSESSANVGERGSTWPRLFCRKCCIIGWRYSPIGPRHRRPWPKTRDQSQAGTGQ